MEEIVEIEGKRYEVRYDPNRADHDVIGEYVGVEDMEELVKAAGAKGLSVTGDAVTVSVEEAVWRGWLVAEPSWKIEARLVRQRGICGAKTVFWPDEEACEAICILHKGHGGTIHEADILGEWDEEEMSTWPASESETREAMRNHVTRFCADCERCTYNRGPDCGRTDHPHCPCCGHCMGRHSGVGPQ